MEAELLQQLFSETGFMLGIVIILLVAVYWLFTTNQSKSDAREERLNALNEAVRKDSKEREDKISGQLDIALSNNVKLASLIEKDLPSIKEDVEFIKQAVKSKQ